MAAGRGMVWIFIQACAMRVTNGGYVPYSGQYPRFLRKAGGILVMTDEIRGTEAEKNPESLNIRVFPGADGSFRLYEDDNETCAYEKWCLCIYGNGL